MRNPTEDDLRMKLPQTQPASLLLSYIFPPLCSFPFQVLSQIFTSFVFLLHTSPSASTYLFFCISVCRSLCLSFCLFFSVSPCFQPLPYTRHLRQQSMPFHSGEGTNGIPAERVAAGGEQRLFCTAVSSLSSGGDPACTRSLSPHMLVSCAWRNLYIHI